MTMSSLRLDTELEVGDTLIHWAFSNPVIFQGVVEATLKETACGFSPWMV